jgi:hypothetical protein
MAISTPFFLDEKEGLTVRVVITPKFAHVTTSGVVGVVKNPVTSISIVITFYEVIQFPTTMLTTLSLIIRVRIKCIPDGHPAR